MTMQMMCEEKHLDIVNVVVLCGCEMCYCKNPVDLRHSCFLAGGDAILHIKILLKLYAAFKVPHEGYRVKVV